MDDTQLRRLLKSVSMEYFVAEQPALTNFTISDQELIDKRRQTPSYTERSCRTRITKSRAIIRAGRAKDALAIIARSSRVPREISDGAAHLLSAQDGLSGAKQIVPRGGSSGGPPPA
jgi:hypothetical protein